MIDHSPYKQFLLMNTDSETYLTMLITSKKEIFRTAREKKDKILGIDYFTTVETSNISITTP